MFKANEPKIDSWIAIDGGSIGRVNNQALGSYRYEVIFDGPGGHSWGAFGLVNPHHALGAGIKNFVEKARGDPRHTSADVSKAQKILGYQPQISLAEGLKREWEWIRSLYS